MNVSLSFIALELLGWKSQSKLSNVLLFFLELPSLEARSIVLLIVTIERKFSSTILFRHVNISHLRTEVEA